MRKNEAEKGLTRRELILGLPSLWASSILLIADVREAIAQKSVRDAMEALALRGKIDAAIKKGTDDIRGVYGIHVTFPQKKVFQLYPEGKSLEYSELTDKAMQLEALLQIRRYLLKFPPRSARQLVHLSTYVKEIIVSEKIQVSGDGSTTHRVGGASLGGRFVIEISRIKLAKEGQETITVLREGFTHEIVHEILNDLTEEQWIRRINDKIQSSDFKTKFPGGYAYAPHYTHGSVRAYASYKPRPHGFARFFGTSNHREDVATVGEHVFHDTVPLSEITKESPPILQVKIEVLKEMIAEKIGYGNKPSEHAEGYWELVRTNSAIDRLNDVSQDKDSLRQSFEKEFQMWTIWWNHFRAK